MHLRRWLLPGVLLALFTAAVILPSTAPGRQWLLERAVAAVDELGYEFSFTSSSGNLWYGLDLSEVRVSGPGVDLATGKLSIDYFLPSLITGDLPLSVELEGVRGSVDPANLAPLNGGGGDSLVTPSLRDLAIRDVAVQVDGSPWTLPALDLEDVSVAREQDELRFSLIAVSDEGRALLGGNVTTTPWRVGLEVHRADARLARHWWAGAEAGTVQGQVVADADGVVGRGYLRGGALNYLDARVEAISGPVSYEGGVVRATLSGRALGGPVTAEVEVNIPARHWEGQLQGAPDLAELSGWLAPDGFSVEELNATGSSRVELEASGWSAVNLSGRGSGAGSLLQLPLEDLQANFDYGSERGVGIQASGTLGGGPLIMSLSPEAGGSQLRLSARRIGLAESLESAWDVQADFGSEGTVGNLSAEVEGDYRGRALALQADGVLDEDGLQLFLSGGDDLGATVEGASVVAGGAAEGRVTINGLILPAFPGPVDLSLSGQGPLTSLPLELRLDGAGSTGMAVTGIVLDEDLAGSAGGVLAGGAIRDLSGDFGPLSFSGELLLSPLALNVDYRIETAGTRGAVESAFGSNGSVEFDADGLQAEGVLRLDRAAAEGAVLGAMDLDLEAFWSGEEGVLLSFASLEEEEEATPRLSGRVSDDSATVEAAQPPLTFAGRPLSLEGSLSLPFGAMPRASLTASATDLLLSLQPAPDGHLLQLNARPGLELGPLTLREPIQASGRIDGELAEGELMGSVAGVPFLADYRRSGSRLEVGSRLGASGELFTLGFDPEAGEWSYDGSADLAPLARAAGLPVEARLSGELMRTAEGLTGGVTAEGAVSGVPLELRLGGDGTLLTIDGSLSTAGFPWLLSGEVGVAPGELLPSASALELEATSDHGTVRLSAGTISGSGRLPAVLGPLTTGAGPWNLTGSLGEQRLVLSTDSSEAVLDWHGGSRLEAEVEEDLRVAGLPSHLSAMLDWSAGASGEIAGSLALPGGALAVSGDLAEVRLWGTLDAPLLSEAFLGSPVVAGVLDIDAALPLADPAGARARLVLRSGDAVIEGRVSGSEVDLSGAGVEASYRRGEFSIGAVDAHLAPFLLLTESGLAANGSLAYGPAQGWQGAMTLQGELPLPGSPQATVHLTGSSDELAAAVDAAGVYYRAEAAGRLLPDLDLALTATALTGGAALEGTASGSLAAPIVDVTLSTEELDFEVLTLPALSLALQGTPASGFELAGEGVFLTLAGSELGGEVDLEVELAGEAHLLRGAIAGTVGLPRLDLALDGPIANGTANWQGENGSADISLEPGTWLPGPLEARGPAQLELSLDRTLDWNASLAAPLLLSDAPLLLQGNLSGTRTSYGGALSLLSAELPAGESTVIEAGLEGTGSEWRVQVDLAATDSPALASLLPVNARLQPRGSLTFTNEHLAIVDAGLNGDVTGRGLDLHLSGDSRTGIDLSGTVAGATLEAALASDGAEYSVAGAGFGLSGDVGWGDDFTLSVTGVAAGVNVTANGNYDPGARTGSLTASLAGAQLEARALPAQGDPAGVEVTASLIGQGAGVAGGPDLLVETRLRVSPDSVVVDRLSLDGSQEQLVDAWAVDMNGSLWPSPSLSGTVSADLPAIGERVSGDLAVTGAALSDPQLQVSVQGIELRLWRGDGSWQASLAGAGEVATAEVEADLDWSDTSGFSGTAGVRLPGTTLGEHSLVSDSYLDLRLTGEGGLGASLALQGADGTSSLVSGELMLSPRPWEDRSLEGELRLTGGLDELWPDYPGAPLALTGRLALGGTILSPTASGPLALAGAVEGRGQLEWTAEGGTAKLEGQGLRVSVAADPDGTLAGTFSAESLDLEPLWPTAQGTTIDLQATVHRAAGAAMGGEISSLTARRGMSTVEGNASLGSVIEARLALDVNLADLPTGAQPFQGTLDGTLSLEAAGLDSLAAGSLRGDLQLADAGLSGTGTSLSGSVTVAGAPGDPSLDLALQARGGAEGDLVVSASPSRGRLQVSSDLSWGEVVSRLQIEAVPTSLTADGRVELPGGAFTVSSPAGSREILLAGEDGYRGWQARLDAQEFSLAVEADLATLDAGVKGTITARAGGKQGAWLAGEARGLAWDGIQAGDLSFRSEAPGAAITVEGESLEATVNPIGGPGWQVERLALDLPNGLGLRGSGSGSGSAGSVELLIAGEFAGSPVSLPLHLDSDPEGTLRVAGSGSLLHGSLTIDALLNDAGWQGTVAANGMEVAGTTTNMAGELSGEPTSPTLDLEASAEGEYASITATSRLSPGQLSLEARVESPYLVDPLNIRGSSEAGGEMILATGASSLTISTAGAGVAVSGEVVIDAGSLRVTLAGRQTDPGTGNALEVLVAAPHLPGLALATTIGEEILEAPATLFTTPLIFSGRGATVGEVRLTPSPLTATVAGLRYQDEALDLRLAGSVGPGMTAQLSGAVRLEAAVGTGLLPTLPPGSELPFEVRLAGESVELTSSGDLGTATLDLNLANGSGSLVTDLRLGSGSLDGRVEFVPGTGPSGTVRARELPLVVLSDQEPLRLNSDIEVTPESLEFFSQLQAAGGSLQADGIIGLGLLLPSEIAPQGNRARRVELQLGTFDLSSVPWVAKRLPHLSAPLSGFLQILGNRIVGRLVAPDLTVAGDPLPLAIDISGTDEEATLSGLVAGSPLQVTVDGRSITALANLERFPLHLLAQAATGPLDVSAEVTGVGRLELPWAGDRGPTVEVATELVRLERAGVVTTGTVSLTLSDGELSVNDASFSGAGTWQAQGAVRRDRLDLSLSATDADFGPLLGLVPLLARYEVGASGSLELNTSGSLDEPVITLATPALDFAVAGSSYRLTDGEAALRNEQLTLSATVQGVEPFTGQLQVAGAGQLDLLPFGLGDARFTAEGNASVPGLGEIEGFQATLTSEPDEPLSLQGGGRLGEEFMLSGTLLPLDLTLSGEDLAIRLPYLLLASAQVDAEVRMQWEESLRFSGRLGVDQALFELGIRPPRSVQSEGPNPVAQQVVFDQIAITAPGRVRFMENFGSAETSLALTLAGSAAQPTLGGTAQVLRGTIQFSGRDFTITSAQARFDPSRGVLPILDVTAVTSFDIDQILPPNGTVRFVSPQERSRFEVVLAFTGELESTPETRPPFSLDLSPALTSEALIQEVRADGTTSPPRPLTEPELLSLITLGRLDLEAPIASEAGLAAAVAEGALDTAVDLLLVSELQNALAEALGLDVVEINTTAISSIFGRAQTEPFSVSLRLGGYLSEEVFASYRIGTFDDVQGLYALTNEVNLIYELGPVEIDLAGRVNFEDTNVPTPDAEVSATVRYDFSGLTAIEGGVDLSDERQQVRFGVTLRW